MTATEKIENVAREVQKIAAEFGHEITLGEAGALAVAGLAAALEVVEPGDIDTQARLQHIVNLIAAHGAAKTAREIERDPGSVGIAALERESQAVLAPSRFNIAVVARAVDDGITVKCHECRGGLLQRASEAGASDCLRCDNCDRVWSTTPGQGEVLRSMRGER